MKRAITMLELIIVIVILGILASIGSETVSYMIGFKTRSQISATLQAEADSALFSIASAIRQSVPESVRLRQSVISNSPGKTCNEDGCKYLYNTKANLITDNYKAIEMAIKMREFNIPWRSNIDNKCVVNLIRNLKDWYDPHGAAPYFNMNVSGIVTNSPGPCFANYEQNALKDHSKQNTIPATQNKMVFRCLAAILPEPLLGKIYTGSTAGKILFRNCNEDLLNPAFIDAMFINTKDPKTISHPDGVKASGNNMLFSDFYGIHFRGEMSSNTSTFLEKDVYPARIKFSQHPSGTEGITKLKNVWSHWQVFIDLAKKNFSISNAIDIISDIKVFELAQKDGNNIAPCTEGPCDLWQASASYDHFINSFSSPYAALDNTDNKLNKAFYVDNTSPDSGVGRVLIARGVSKFNIQDENGVRSINICLERDAPSSALAKLLGTGVGKIKVCRSEVI